MKPAIIISVLCALTLAAVLSALALTRHDEPKSGPTGHPRTFQVRGQIRAVDLAGKRVRIAHEEIPHYMPAMTMPFPVKDANALQGLAAGENVQFELTVTENDSWISHIESIATEASEIQTPSATAPNAEADRLQPGEVVPDFSLTDQNGQPLRLSHFRGKVVLLTFIYTRCPLPNFCPLMSKNFADLQERLNKGFPNQYRLLSITMDPDFDRPAVLKDYAARYDANEADWSFATGNAEQISFVAGLMGLYYAPGNGLISHDFRTALIGPNGRLVHLWKSNVWTPYEVERVVRETLAPSKEVTSK